VNDLRIFSIIPARGGSKGVPKKNIRVVMGHPLIAYSIRASLRSKLINRTLVSTDSEEIAAIAGEYGAEVPFIRPAELAKDTSTDYEFVAHALGWLSENEGSTPEYLVHLRPTTPLREVTVVDTAIETMIASTQATALRSVHEMAESAYKCFEVEDGVLKSVGTNAFEVDAANIARQQFTKTYKANGYVDVLSTSFILKHQKIHGNRVLGFITPYAIEVDTLEDLEFLEYKISRGTQVFRALFG
jgi:CMP-N,N'-diacetyllegionaminic acid synthase